MKVLNFFLLVLLLFLTFYTTHKIKREILTERECREEYGKEGFKFKLKNLEGKEVSLENQKESAIILIFFATWCGPCKMELETLKEEEALLYNYNVKLYLVSSEGEEIVKNFMEKNGFNFEVLLDEKGEVFKAYYANRIPKTVILDEKGTIIFSKVGKMDTAYDIISKLPPRFVVPNKERRIYKEVDKILDTIPCDCTCGKSILNCDCKDCRLKKEREYIRFYASRLMDKEKFKKEQVSQIIKWKYIENREEKK